MLISLFPYLWSINYDFTKSSVMIISWIIVYRVADAFSDLFQGYFQQHGRLDIAGKAMVYRYIFKRPRSFIWALVVSFYGFDSDGPSFHQSVFCICL